MRWLVVLGLVASCGDNAASCIPGEQQACGCPGGATGAQVCSSAGRFEACLGCPADAAIDGPPPPCAAQTDCPLGFDCGLAHPTDPAPTCYRRTYDTSPGAFGTSCAIAACSGTPSPCAPGFACNAAFECDPEATCSRDCTDDSACPPTMYCSPAQHCAPRGACEPCVIDDQCGPDARCATDGRGERYCAKTCADDSDCPPPRSNTAGETPSRFERCRVDLGGRGLVCQPTDGYCHGPSAVASQPEGGVCAWCRPDHPDCSVDRCFATPFTAERFCTLPCTVGVTAAGTFHDDTCPAGTFCYYGGEPCATDCTMPGICVGDPTYRFMTCYP